MDPTKPDSPTHAQKPLATWRRAFLVALAEHANVTKAAKAAEVNRAYAYECRGKDPSFLLEWDEALEEAADKLEARAWARATFEDIQYKFTKTGEPILHPVTGAPYYEHVGSDTVLLRMLEALRPDRFKRRSEVTGKDGAPLVPPPNTDNLSREDLLAILAVRRKLGGGEAPDA